MTVRKTDDNVILQMLNEGKSLHEIAKHFDCSPNAIWKRKQIILPPPEPEAFSKLTAKQKKFTLAIADGKSQQNAALISHDCKSKESADAMGHQLMQRSDIQTAIQEIMQQEGLTRRYRVRRLKSHIDHADPNVSLKGLDQSWKLEGLYTERLEISQPSYDEVDKHSGELRKELEALGVRVEDVLDGEAAIVEDEKG